MAGSDKSDGFHKFVPRSVLLLVQFGPNITDSTLHGEPKCCNAVNGQYLWTARVRSETLRRILTPISFPQATARIRLELLEQVMKLMKLVAIVFCLLVTSDLTRAQVPPDYQAARDSAPSLSSLFGGGNNGGGALGGLFGGGGNTGGGLGGLLGGGNSSNNTGGGGLGGHLNQALNLYRGASGQQAQSQGALGGLQKLQGLQGLLPALGGNGQNTNTGTDFLSKLNQSSKSLVDRTTGWARQKKQEMSQKMLGNTLGNLVPGLNQQQQSSQTKSAFDWLKPKAFQAPTQPPVRAAQNYGQQPDIRY